VNSYLFFDVQSSSHTRRKESLSRSGRGHSSLNKSMTGVHTSSWIIKVFAPCLRLMGDTLRNILLDQVSMQFFLLFFSLLCFFFSFHFSSCFFSFQKCFTKIWTHKSYIKGYSCTSHQVGQQWASLRDMTLDRESPNRSCSFGIDLNTSTWFAPTSDKMG
jgi:hypothetical protein